TTEFVIKNLKVNKVDAVAIHGGRSQNKRSRTIELFNKGKVGVLVCTDVAARGLHIEDVSYVYNYDIPIEPKDYVHRIGRTARAGDSGMAVNILCEYDYDNFSRLQREYNEFTIGSQEIPKLMPIQMVRVAPNRGGPRRFGSNRGSGRGGFGRGPRRGPGRSNFSRGSPDSRKPFYAGARRNFRK
ncbi:C-terminal helicase domain-containing protein, partial [Candidatus Woesearchaeota archaeon]|nr:C-terminal helicase domain-containing protein [Candidatus Woesearchaeota archaeon]